MQINGSGIRHIIIVGFMGTHIGTHSYIAPKNKGFLCLIKYACFHTQKNQEVTNSSSYAIMRKNGGVI